MSSLTVSALVLQVVDPPLGGPEVARRRPPRLLAQLADPRVGVVRRGAALVESRVEAEAAALGEVAHVVQLLVRLADELVLRHASEGPLFPTRSTWGINVEILFDFQQPMHELLWKN